MTEAQSKRFYFPAWHKASLAQNWRMERGRLLASRQASWGFKEVDAAYHAVWDAAEGLARQQHRAVTAEDLRHGCHVAALGVDKSSTEFSNKELDRVVTLFKLLANAEDVDAMMDWLHPENAERKRLSWAVKQYPFAYVDKICRGKFGGFYQSPFFEDLPIAALRQLAMTLRGRARARREPVQSHPF